MKKNSFVYKVIYLFAKILINQFNYVNKIIIKSNDETVTQLLKTDVDKAKFQNAIDSVIKTSKETNITLNGKKVTISI